MFLEDEWEYLHFRIWINSRTATGFSVQIDAQTVFVYCKEYGLNKVETLELVKQMEGEASRE